MKLNDFEFSGNYIITQIQHDSATPQELNTLELSRRDGEKLISSNFGVKEIILRGIVKADSLTELESNIDELKRSVMITDGNFDIDYAGEYRRYLVNCISCTISREHYNITYAPFEIKFKVGDPPFAKSVDSLGGNLRMTEAFSVENSTQESIQDSFSVNGTAIPKVKIRYKFDAIGDISSIDFINLSTSRQLNIATAFTSGDELLIDHDNLNVTLNGEPVEFEGVFPELKLGSNNFESNLYLSSGTILDAYQTTNNFSKPLYGAIKLAQSFQVSTNGLIPKIQLLLRKIGDINSDITLRIETDNTGQPSGTMVSNGEYTISGSNISSSAFWINTSCTDLELFTGTTYWIVLSTTNGSSDSYYEWRANSVGGYSSGNGARYFNSWSTLIADFCFKIYKNIVDVNNVSETQEVFTENFSGTTYKDAINTTANWDTSNGRLILNQDSETLDQSSTTTGSAMPFANGSIPNTLNFEIIPDYSGTLSKISIRLDKTGSPSGNISVELWTGVYSSEKDAYYPGTKLGKSTNYKTPAQITTSMTEYDFTFNYIPITEDVHYIVVIKCSATNNTSHYYKVDTAGYLPLFSIYTYNWNDSINNGVLPAGSAYKFYFKQYYVSYDTDNKIGQSSELDSISSSIVAATISKTDSTPSTTTIDYELSSDGSNYETITPGTEKWFTYIGNTLEFKTTLNGNVSYSPYIDSLTISYKAAMVIWQTTHRVAQSFISGFTGDLGRIKLNIKKNGAPGALTIAIYSDSGGVPDSLLASQVYSGAILSDQFGWISVNFNTAPSLTTTTTYWIVISAASVDGTNSYYIRSKPGNTYSNGILKYSSNSGGSYTEYSNEDILMQTYPSSGLQHQFDMKIEYNPRYL